jgi:hypothetical protein
VSAFVNSRALFLLKRENLMKLSYNQKTHEFVVSELGRIVDSDIDLDAIAVRHGFVAPSTDEEMTDEESLEMVEDFLKCD